MQFLTYSPQANVPSWVWKTLAGSMATEPSIMGSRATSENLCRIFEESRAVLGWTDERPVGFIAAWDAPDGFLEIGAAWVAPDWRGQAHGNRLVQEIVALLQGQERYAFAITTNPRFVAAAKKAGMRLHETWGDPIPWSATCGPCDDMSPEKKLSCPKRNGACRLLIFPDGGH